MPDGTFYDQLQLGDFSLQHALFIVSVESVQLLFAGNAAQATFTSRLSHTLASSGFKCGHRR